MTLETDKGASQQLHANREGQGNHQNLNGINRNVTFFQATDKNLMETLPTRKQTFIGAATARVLSTYSEDEYKIFVRCAKSLKARLDFLKK